MDRFLNPLKRGSQNLKTKASKTVSSNIMSDHIFHASNGAILHVYTPNELLDRGLQLVSPIDNETRAMSFIDLFGVDHTVASRVWLELQTTEIPLAHMNVAEDGTCLDDYLLALFFLKAYKKQVFNEIELKKSTTTIRKWTQFYISRIGALGADKIFWPQGPSEHEVITISTVHCNVGGFTMACSGWDKAKFFSDKTKQYAFAYEIGLSAFEPRIVWKAGPYRASNTDKEIYERYGLKAKLEGTPTIGIAGISYQGASSPLRVVGPNDPAYTCPDLKLKMLQRHEKLIGIMKQYGCLSASSTSEPFRHTAEMHWMCFEAVIVLTQFQIEARPDLLRI